MAAARIMVVVVVDAVGEVVGAVDVVEVGVAEADGVDEAEGVMVDGEVTGRRVTADTETGGTPVRRRSGIGNTTSSGEEHPYCGGRKKSTIRSAKV